MALRVSLGARRWRLGQLVLVEAAIIGLLASAIGWCFAQWSAPLVLARVNPPDNPARLSLAMDGRTLACAAVLTLFVSLLFGVAPALRASAIRPVEVLKGGDSSPSRARWMRALIALQAAFCFAVLFVAGLFVVTFDRLHGQPNGFSSERIVNIDIVNPRNEPSALWDQVADHLRTMPGIQAVAYADWPLLDGYGFKTDAISINSGPPSEVPAWFMNVSPGWLDTMKIPFISGRDFLPADLSPGAAIVNETFARQFFAHENPVGKWFEGTSGWMQRPKVSNRRSGTRRPLPLSPSDRSARSLHAFPKDRGQRHHAGRDVRRPHLDLKPARARLHSAQRNSPYPPGIPCQQHAYAAGVDRFANRPRALAGHARAFFRICRAAARRRRALRRPRLLRVAAPARDRHPHGLGSPTATTWLSG